MAVRTFSTPISSIMTSWHNVNPQVSLHTIILSLFTLVFFFLLSSITLENRCASTPEFSMSLDALDYNVYCDEAHLLVSTEVK